MDQLFTNSYFSQFCLDSAFPLHPVWGEKDCYLLSSPHIPIAALAANRVIIIVINITFLPLKPLNLLTSNTFYFLPIDFSYLLTFSLPIVLVILSMQSSVFTFNFTYLLVIP